MCEVYPTLFPLNRDLATLRYIGLTVKKPGGPTAATLLFMELFSMPYFTSE
jgi:hypothetical protein